MSILYNKVIWVSLCQLKKKKKKSIIEPPQLLNEMFLVKHRHPRPCDYHCRKWTLLSSNVGQGYLHFILYYYPQLWVYKKGRLGSLTLILATILEEGKLSLVWFDGMSTIIGYLIPNPVYTYIGKVGNRSQGWPEGSLFNSYYTKV